MKKYILTKFERKEKIRKIRPKVKLFLKTF